MVVDTFLYNFRLIQASSTKEGGVDYDKKKIKSLNKIIKVDFRFILRNE